MKLAQHNTPEPAQTFGLHGMLVFGGGRDDQFVEFPVYISHLPMFMAPHDFQVIAQVRGDALEIYGNFIAHFGFSSIYTFKPKPFAIDELNPSTGTPKRKSISGSLFRGHFERGGDDIAADTSFDVEQMIHYNQFSTAAEAAPRGRLQYICFGSRDAAYLAHVITGITGITGQGHISE